MAQFIPGVNDFETWCHQNGREDLLKMWHPVKNGSLKPSEVTHGARKQVWWLLPYDDPKTGKHFEFVWQARIVEQSLRTHASPYLAAGMIWVGFNDLATTHPELAQQWHPTKNGKLTPTKVTKGSPRKVWWLFPYDDPNTGKHFDFEWEARIADRANGIGCPYLSGQAAWPGFNDLATLHPELIKEWHPTKNGTLRPSDVMSSSSQKVWWSLPYDDPVTKKHFDFEWEASVGSRTKNTICPYLTGNKVWPGFNDLASTHPALAAEWHPTKNDGLNPTDVSAGSHKKVWWQVSYDDPNTGKHFDFEWEAVIQNRVNGCNCPYLTGRAIYPGFNDLATTAPDLAKQWHPTKNGSLKPTDITAGSTKGVWWICPTCGTEFKTSPSRRSNESAECPNCYGSMGEKTITRLLTSAGIEFEREYKFGAGQIKYYPFDFYIPEHGIVLEYDGEQHFEYTDYFFQTRAQFDKRVNVDNKKTKFCKDNGLALLRIPHTYQSEADIGQLVSEFIRTKLVPDEVLDFYAQYEFNNYSELYDTIK